jgi:branched-chain amino acid transport system permease protein
VFHDLISQFWPSTVNGLASGAIYALIALGYTMVYGVLRLINFAHSEIFMIGSFASMFVLEQAGFTHVSSGLTLVGILLLSIAAAVAGSAGSAVLLERIAYRPLRKRGSSRLAALISAIGASIFLQELFGVVVIPHVAAFHQPNGKDQVIPPHLMDKHQWFSIFGASVRNDKVIVFVAAILMMIVLDQFVNRTKVGRGIRATAQDPETSVLMGVNIDRIIVITFLVGGVMAGVASALYSFEFENLGYAMGFLPGIKAFTAAVMGGIGNLRGALIGGLVLGLVEAYGASMVGSEWKDVIAFGILVLVLMFRPTGILGESLQQARA